MGAFFMDYDERYMRFYEADTRELLAVALGTKPNRLSYYLYVLPESERYKKKSILKKSGKVRNVAAPTGGLKFIQRNLADILTGSLAQKSCVHGFAPDKTLVRSFPGGPVANAVLPTHGVWVQPLVRELDPTCRD